MYVKPEAWTDWRLPIIIEHDSQEPNKLYMVGPN